MANESGIFPWRGLSLLMGCALWSGCAATRPPITTVPHVDLQHFAGDWYVIANIPTFVEEGAFNAVESYRVDDDGTIDTTFTFRKGAFDGEKRTYNPRGYVLDERSNAVWGMQFVWPFQGDYRIVHLDADYSQTIIGREKRDYVWIMARTPSIPDSDFQKLVGIVAAEGYDTSKLQKVPQQWQPGERP